MLKAILYALLFALVGLVAFALIAPLIFSGDQRKLGASAFPIIVVLCGAIGFWFGLRRSNRRRG